MISRIAKYPVEGELGKGGMGRVYRAFDPDVKRPVAIKVLLGESEPELLRRFWAEIDIIGNLQHKNIVTLFEGGEDSGVPYLVMELLPGRTLDSIVKNKIELTVLDKVRIMTQVAQGLAYAHSKGIIHRDVKPSNIMLLPDGLVKILDFGIARVTNRDTVLTRLGANPGTPSYMAPEQFGLAKADEQGDIFSYGVVYYELLTGKHPFWVPNDFDSTVRRIKTYEPESVAQVVPGCPEALELLVHRAIAKDREIRYATFSELLLDSEAILADLQHERAVQILAEVAPLIDSGDYANAESKLAQTLELDPGNREARELWRSVQKRIGEDRLSKRMATLFAQSQAQIEQRQFAEAVETLEAALRLKKNDPEVQRRLAEANVLLNAHLRANRLVAEARRDQQKDQLPDALRKLQEALQYDPQHSDARLLVRRVHTEVERRQREDRIQRAIGIASDARAQKRFDDALAALADVESEDASGRVAQLRAQIESEKAEAGRRKRAERFNIAVSKVREAIHSRELVRAGQQLDFLESQFRDEPGASEILPQLRADLDAQLRAEAISAYNKRARELLTHRSFPEALDVLKEALDRFPDDAALLRLRQETEAKYAAQQRAEAVAAVVKEARALLDAGRAHEAADALAQGRQRIGDDPAFAELDREIASELERQRYAAGLQQLVQRVNELSTAERFEDAIKAIDAAPQYHNESEIAALLASARSGAAITRERRAVQSALESSAALVAQGANERALAILEQALREYPHNPDLSVAANTLRDRIAEAARQARIAENRAAVERFIEQRDWKKAEPAVERARREFPGEAVFHELAEQIRRALLDENLAQVEGEVREKLAANNVADASEQMNATRILYGGDPRWKALEQDVANRRAYETALAGVAALRSRGELDKAEAKLDALVREGAADDRAARMLAEVRNERELVARSERDRFEASLADAIAVVRESLSANRWADVSEQLKTGRVYAGDPRWKALEQEVAWRKTYESGLQDAAGLRERGDLQGSEGRLSALLREGAPDDRAAQMLRRVRYESGLREAESLPPPDVEARLRELARDAPDDRAAQMLRRVRYESGLREAESLALSDAEARLRELARDAPDDRAAEMLRNVRLESGLREAKSLRDRGDLEKAEQRLTALDREPLFDGRTMQLLSDIRHARLAAARDVVARGEFDKGLQLMETLKAGAPPEWARTIDAARDEAGKQRAAEIARIAASVREKIARDDIGAATAELTAGESRFGHEESWTVLGAELQARAQFLDALHKAEQARQRGNYDEATRLLSALKASDAASQRRVAALRDAVNAERAQKERAEAIQAAKRRVDQLRRGDPKKLIAFLDEARQRFPEERSFGEQYERAIAEVEQAKARVSDAVVEPQPKLPAPPPEPAPAPVSAPRRTTTWIATAAGAVLVLGGGAYWFLAHNPPESKPHVAQVRISSDPAGASVRLNDQACTTPCVIKAPAGSYSMSARLDGYEPVTQDVVISDQDGEVRFALKAVPPPPPPPPPALSGTVEVATNQDDATVLVNGQRYGLATTRKPVVAALKAGDYRIRVEKPNYTASDQRVRIEAGQSKRLAFDLKPLPGHLAVSGALPDTQVVIDGVPKGKISGTGTLTAELNPGQHQITLSHDGYSPRQESFDVEPNQTITLGPGRVELTKIASPPPAPATVEIATNQDGTTVLVNGEQVGVATTRTPFVASLKPGDYRVHVQKPNYASSEQVVHVDAGQKKRVAFDLNPLPGRLAITGALPDTQVAVDGVVKGSVAANGTLTAELNPGQHQIRLSHEGYTTRQESIDVAANQTITLGPGRVELTKTGPPPPDRAEVARQALSTVANDPEALDNFARRYDGTPAAIEARQRAEQLRNQGRAEDQAVRAALDQFNAAFQHRSARELKRIWPTASSLFVDSAQTSRSVALRPIGQVQSTAPNTASIDCELITTNTVRVKVVLQKTGDHWLIVSVSGA